jgi:hypothetical protein
LFIQGELDQCPFNGERSRALRRDLSWLRSAMF